MISSAKTEANTTTAENNESKIMQAMEELEREASRFDENNPRHTAHLMRKIQRILPENAILTEMETVAKRLESGEEPEKIEEDMQELFSQPPHLVTEDFPENEENFARDPGLYDF